LTFTVARQRSTRKNLGFDAIEGVQEGAEKPPAAQRIDGAMATFGTDLPLTSDLAIYRSS
jgi:hypothetical protein